MEESERNSRFLWLDNMVKKYNIKTLLDYGCHMGSSSILTSNRNQDCKIFAYDLSERAIKKAETRKNKYSKNKDNLAFIDKLSFGEAKFDAIFCGELLEHVPDPEAKIKELEEYIKDGGYMFITIPKGAWEWIKHEDNHKNNVIYHVHGFDYWDVFNMFGDKTDFKCETLRCFSGIYDEQMGNYLISYKVDGKPTGKRDLNRKLLTYRPYQSISACIIAKDSAKEIESMIESIHTEMDEIIVGIDPSTKDETMVRLEKYYKVKAFVMPYSVSKPDFWGFANARNWVLDKARCKWIFWIDTDEKIIQTEKFRKYLDGDLINSFVIKQHHAQMDNFIVADNPQRLFRRGTGQFVGYIHEQPQNIDDINESIEPSLILNGIDIVNFGEVTEGIRRSKAIGRNLELLKKDVLENVDKRKKDGLQIRKLSIILLMRDFYNRIKWGAEYYGTEDTKDAFGLCLPNIKKLFDKYFANEKNPLFRDMAEKILQLTYNELKIGIPIDINLDGKKYLRRVDKSDIARFLDEIKETLENKMFPRE
jgi:SAM-dependent methyltransferase